jgi:hypothetical protein
MSVDEFFRLRARLVELARTVDADNREIGVLSTGEACAVALCSIASNYLTATTSARSTFSNGSARSGKRRRVIVTTADGGND